jgi:hypothetical protein
MSTAPQELLQTHSEIAAMALLSELLPAISLGLDSLGGKMPNGVEDLVPRGNGKIISLDYCKWNFLK